MELAPRLVPSREPQVVAATDDYAVVDKPAHLLVHPTRPTGEPTLLDWLRERYPGHEPALVNRLDRETSGLVLAGLHPEASSRLGKQMMARGFWKSYLAITWGEVARETGEIDAPIARLGISESNAVYLKRGVVPDGQPARTEYWRLAARDGFSLLRVQAHTGRLHQIRVHLSHLGHPVVGDKIYGPDSSLYLDFIERGWTEEHARRLLLPRHALHAHQLAFRWNDEDLRYETPPPPELLAFAQERGLLDPCSQLASPGPN